MSDTCRCRGHLRAPQAAAKLDMCANDPFNTCCTACRCMGICQRESAHLAEAKRLWVALAAGAVPSRPIFLCALIIKHACSCSVSIHECHAAHAAASCL